MKYSKSAIGLLTREYRSVLKKCLLINLGLFALGAATLATPANAVVISGDTNLNTDFSEGVITVIGDNAKGIDSTSVNGYTTTFTTPTINITANGTKGRGVDAWWGSNVTLGGEDTTSVSVTGTQRGLSIFDPDTVVNVNSTGSVALTGGESGAAVVDRSKLNMTAQDITVTSSDGDGISAETGRDGNGHYIPNSGGKINIDTDNLTVTAKNSGVAASYSKSQIDINATGDVNIKATGDNSYARAVNVGNSSTDDNITKENTSYVSIKAKNINLTSNTNSGGIGIAAMSNGIVELEGNTTIVAQNAIDTRGKAITNINASGNNTVKIDGDIVFDYYNNPDNPGNSGSPVDATVNINLTNSDSYWTGNSYVDWYDGSGVAEPTEDKLKVTGFNVSLSDGATWNAKKVTESGAGTNTGKRYTALNNLNVDGGVINFQDADAQMQVDNLSIGSKGVSVTNGTMNVSGLFDSRNGKIDSATDFAGITPGANSSMYVDANLGSAVIDAITGGTIKKVNLLASAYGDTNAEVTLAGNYDTNVEVDGFSYYTKVEKTADGLKFSDKLVNTSGMNKAIQNRIALATNEEYDANTKAYSTAAADAAIDAKIAAQDFSAYAKKTDTTQTITSGAYKYANGWYSDSAAGRVAIRAANTKPISILESDGYHLYNDGTKYFAATKNGLYLYNGVDGDEKPNPVFEVFTSTGSITTKGEIILDKGGENQVSLNGAKVKGYDAATALVNNETKGNNALYNALGTKANAFTLGDGLDYGTGDKASEISVQTGNGLMIDTDGKVAINKVAEGSGLDYDNNGAVKVAGLTNDHIAADAGISADKIAAGTTNAVVTLTEKGGYDAAVVALGHASDSTTDPATPATGLFADVEGNTAAINTLNGTGAGSVAKSIHDSAKNANFSGSDGSEVTIADAINSKMNTTDWTLSTDATKLDGAKIGAGTVAKAALATGLSDEITASTNKFTGMTDDTVQASINTAVADSVKYTIISETEIKTETGTEIKKRKAIVLNNHDTILGTDEHGSTYNLAMVSKWNVADFGSSAIHMNLNSKDGVATLNDEQVVLTDQLLNKVVAADGNIVMTESNADAGAGEDSIAYKKYTFSTNPDLNAKSLTLNSTDTAKAALTMNGTSVNSIDQVTGASEGNNVLASKATVNKAVTDGLATKSLKINGTVKDEEFVADGTATVKDGDVEATFYTKDAADTLVNNAWNKVQGWANKEFGYDTNTTDAKTVLKNAGFTVEGEGKNAKLGFSQAIIQNKAAIDAYKTLNDARFEDKFDQDDPTKVIGKKTVVDSIQDALKNPKQDITAEDITAETLTLPNANTTAAAETVKLENVTTDMINSTNNAGNTIATAESVYKALGKVDKLITESGGYRVFDGNQGEGMTALSSTNLDNGHYYGNLATGTEVARDLVSLDNAVGNLNFKAIDAEGEGVIQTNYLNGVATVSGALQTLDGTIKGVVDDVTLAWTKAYNWSSYVLGVNPFETKETQLQTSLNALGAAAPTGDGKGNNIAATNFAGALHELDVEKFAKADIVTTINDLASTDNTVYSAAKTDAVISSNISDSILTADTSKYMYGEVKTAENAKKAVSAGALTQLVDEVGTNMKADQLGWNINVAPIESDSFASSLKGSFYEDLTGTNRTVIGALNKAGDAIKVNTDHIGNMNFTSAKIEGVKNATDLSTAVRALDQYINIDTAGWEEYEVLHADGTYGTSAADNIGDAVKYLARNSMNATDDQKISGSKNFTGTTTLAKLAMGSTIVEGIDTTVKADSGNLVTSGAVSTALEPYAKTADVIATSALATYGTTVLDDTKNEVYTAKSIKGALDKAGTAIQGINVQKGDAISVTVDDATKKATITYTDADTTYTQGNGVAISDSNAISVKLAAQNSGLAVDEAGLKVSGITDDNIASVSQSKITGLADDLAKKANVADYKIKTASDEFTVADGQLSVNSIAVDKISGLAAVAKTGNFANLTVDDGAIKRAMIEDGAINRKKLAKGIKDSLDLADSSLQGIAKKSEDYITVNGNNKLKVGKIKVSNIDDTAFGNIVVNGTNLVKSGTIYSYFLGYAKLGGAANFSSLTLGTAAAGETLQQATAISDGTALSLDNQRQPATYRSTLATNETVVNTINAALAAGESIEGKDHYWTGDNVFKKNVTFQDGITVTGTTDTQNLKIGDATVSSIDKGTTAVAVGAGDPTKLATTATVMASAQNATFTAPTGDAAVASLGSAATIHDAIVNVGTVVDNVNAKIGDIDFTGANNIHNTTGNAKPTLTDAVNQLDKAIGKVADITAAYAKTVTESGSSNPADIATAINNVATAAAKADGNLNFNQKFTTSDGKAVADDGSNKAADLTTAINNVAKNAEAAIENAVGDVRAEIHGDTGDHKEVKLGNLAEKVIVGSSQTNTSGSKPETEIIAGIGIDTVGREVEIAAVNENSEVGADFDAKNEKVTVSAGNKTGNTTGMEIDNKGQSITMTSSDADHITTGMEISNKSGTRTVTLGTKTENASGEELSHYTLEVDGEKKTTTIGSGDGKEVVIGEGTILADKSVMVGDPAGKVTAMYDTGIVAKENDNNQSTLGSTGLWVKKGSDKAGVSGTGMWASDGTKTANVSKTGLWVGEGTNSVSVGSTGVYVTDGTDHSHMGPAGIYTTKDVTAAGYVSGKEVVAQEGLTLAGTRVSAIDTDGSKVSADVAQATRKATLATAETVYAGAENAKFTPAEGETGVTKEATTLHEAIAVLDDAMGDMVLKTANKNLVDNTGAALDNATDALNALDGVVGNVKDLDVSKGNLHASNKDVASHLSALDARLGTIKAINGGGKGNLAKADSDVATHFNSLDVAMGNRTNYKNNSGSNGYVAVNDGTKDLTTMISEVASNIGKAGDIRSTNQISAQQTVNANLSSLDAAIGNVDALSEELGATDLTSAINNLNTKVNESNGAFSKAINQLDMDQRKLRHDFEAGMAGQAALSALVPNAKASGNTQLAVGTGAYKGHTAAAVGGFHWFTDNLLFNAGVAWDNNEATGRMGITYSW